MAEPGRRLLGGRYELGTLLATGGQGQVWRARDTVLSRQVAVKVLRSEFTGDPTFLARFRAEAQHAALVAHPHIAALFDYGELDDAVTGERLAFLVMELVEGESLADLLVREGRLPVPRTLDDAAPGRRRAGRGARRRARAPRREAGQRPRGRRRLDQADRLRHRRVGLQPAADPDRPGRRAPRTTSRRSRRRGNRAGAASDVYALGLVGYECLAGRRAFDGENSVQIALSHLGTPPTRCRTTSPSRCGC